MKFTRIAFLLLLLSLCGTVFAQNAASLTEIINDMVAQFADVSNAVDESSNAVATAAQNTTELVGEISQINSDVNINKDISDSFKETTSKFDVNSDDAVEEGIEEGEVTDI